MIWVSYPAFKEIALSSQNIAKHGWTCSGDVMQCSWKKKHRQASGRKYDHCQNMFWMIFDDRDKVKIPKWVFIVSNTYSTIITSSAWKLKKWANTGISFVAVTLWLSVNYLWDLNDGSWHLHLWKRLLKMLNSIMFRPLSAPMSIRSS